MLCTHLMIMSLKRTPKAILCTGLLLFCFSEANVLYKVVRNNNNNNNNCLCLNREGNEWERYREELFKYKCKLVLSLLSLVNHTPISGFLNSEESKLYSYFSQKLRNIPWMLNILVCVFEKKYKAQKNVYSIRISSK